MSEEQLRFFALVDALTRHIELAHANHQPVPELCEEVLDRSLHYAASFGHFWYGAYEYEWSMQAMRAALLVLVPRVIH